MAMVRETPGVGEPGWHAAVGRVAGRPPSDAAARQVDSLRPTTHGHQPRGRHVQHSNVSQWGLAMSLRKAFAAGPSELKRMATQHAAEFASDIERLIESAKQLLLAAWQASHELYGQYATQFSWRRPFQVALGSALLCAGIGASVAMTFTGATLNLPRWQLVATALGLLFAPVALHVAQVAPKIGNVDELPKLAENAERRRGFAIIAVLLTTGTFAAVRSIGTLVRFSTLSLYSLEAAYGWAVGECVVIALVHFEVGSMFAHARRFERDAQRLQAVLINLGAYERDSRKDVPPPPPPNGSPTGELPPHAAPGTNGQVKLVEGGTARSSTSRGQSSAVGRALVIALIALALSQSARAETARVYIDRTHSGFAPELRDVVSRIAVSFARAAAACPRQVTVEVFLWDGSPLSSRVPSGRFELDSLRFQCDPTFPVQCEYERRRAEERLAATRGPVIAAMERLLANAAIAPLATRRSSCMPALFNDALLSDVAIIVTDAVPDGYGKQQLPAANAAHRPFVVVISHTADCAPQDSIAARVTRLRHRGYVAINSGEVGSVAWDRVLCGRTR